MEQHQEDQTMSDFDDFQKRTSDIYPQEKALEYLTLRLVGQTGALAKEVARIARGDYESKGALAYEFAVGRIMEECTYILEQVALISTVLEKKLSDVIDYGTNARRQFTGEKDARRENL